MYSIIFISITLIIYIFGLFILFKTNKMKTIFTNKFIALCYNQINKTFLIKQLTILFVLIIIIIILYSLNFNQLEFLFKFYNSPSPETINYFLKNVYKF